jgi:hypothetical protein
LVPASVHPVSLLSASHSANPSPKGWLGKWGKGTRTNLGFAGCEIDLDRQELRRAD